MVEASKSKVFYGFWLIFEGFHRVEAPESRKHIRLCFVFNQLFSVLFKWFWWILEGLQGVEAAKLRKTVTKR